MKNINNKYNKIYINNNFLNLRNYYSLLNIYIFLNSIYLIIIWKYKNNRYIKLIFYIIYINYIIFKKIYIYLKKLLI